MQKEKAGEFLFTSWAHVTILSAIQVYRFYEMCQGIVNNPALSWNVL
jgi:hypothetical protein